MLYYIVLSVILLLLIFVLDSKKYLTPTFWLKKFKNCNDVIMSEKEISDFNSEVYDNNNCIKTLTNFPDSLEPDLVKGLIVNARFYDLAKEENYDLDNITGELLYAINLSYSNTRAAPTYQSSTSEKDSVDKVSMSKLRFGEPIIILHKTADNLWCFFQSEAYRGWTEIKNIVFIDKTAFTSYARYEKFLMVIAKNIKIANKTIDMGTKLNLVDETKNKYIVSIPTKDSNGNLVFIKSSINKNSNIVVKGYLPYTKHNIIKQVMRCYHMPYAWGNSEYGVDCSGFVLNVYKTFGFKIPRNSALQQCCGGDFVKTDENTIDEELEKSSLGSLLYKPGHIMIYLGKIKNDFYVIHSASSKKTFSLSLNTNGVIISTLNKKEGDNITKNLISSITRMVKKQENV